MAKEIKCKSCGTVCVVDGDEITCPTCDVTFIRRASGDKVQGIGRLDKIEKDIVEIQKIVKLEPEPEPEPEPGPEQPPAEPGESQEDEDEDDW